MCVFICFKVFSTEDQQSRIDSYNDKVEREAFESDNDEPDISNKNVTTQATVPTTSSNNNEQAGAELGLNLFPVFNIMKRKQTQCSHDKNKLIDFNANDRRIIVGSADVVGLYPACKALHSGQVVKELILKSKMEVRSVNYRECARYCAMKYSKSEIYANGIARVVPTRRFTKGTKPGLTGCGPRGKVADDEEIWVFPDREPTELEKRRLLACNVEIGIRMLFRSHLYQFIGKVYLQNDGGPIGVRLSGAVARAVMGEWDAKINEVFADERLRIKLICRYVDDCTILMTAIKRGVKWCRKCKGLAYSKAWEVEDSKEGLSDSARTMQVVQDIMNSIYRNIEVTIETPDHFL